MQQLATTFQAKLWIYPSETASWHFVTLPRSVGDAVKAATHGSRRGFGSVPVTAIIGSSTIATSVFPDRQSKSFILPIKASARKAEELLAGDTLTITLSLR